MTVAEKGFFILPSELFENVCKKAGADENLNETLERVFRNIEGSAVGSDSEDDLKGLFDDLDINSSKLGATVAKRNEKLVKLLDAIGDLPFGNFEDNSIDLFGDAYEYLMQMYASQAGKSGGEYYTPQEVSEVLAKITVMGKKRVTKVYDPVAAAARFRSFRQSAPVAVEPTGITGAIAFRFTHRLLASWSSSRARMRDGVTAMIASISGSSSTKSASASANPSRCGCKGPTTNTRSGETAHL